MKTTRKLCLSLSLMLTGVAWASVATADAGPTASAVDRELLAALHDGDADAVGRALESGADPNASVGERGYDQSLCVATMPGREPLLTLLIEYGADVDRLYGGIGSYGSALTCAVSHDNTKAIDLLVAAGATPDLGLCPECSYEANWGPFEIAVLDGYFRGAWYLAQIGVNGERERNLLKRSLERFPPMVHEERDPYRRKLIDWLRGQGVEVVPYEDGRRGKRARKLERNR